MWWGEQTPGVLRSCQKLHFIKWPVQDGSKMSQRFRQRLLYPDVLDQSENQKINWCKCKMWIGPKPDRKDADFRPKGRFCLFNVACPHTIVRSLSSLSRVLRQWWWDNSEHQRNNGGVMILASVGGVYCSSLGRFLPVLLYQHRKENKSRTSSSST